MVCQFFQIKGCQKQKQSISNGQTVEDDIH